MIESEVKQEEAQASAAASPVDSAPEAPQAEKKPVRRRTKKADAEAATQVAPDAAASAGEDTPKPRRARTRKADGEGASEKATAAKKASAPAAAEASAADASKAEAALSANDEAPKPCRTRARKVADASQVIASDNASAVKEPAASGASQEASQGASQDVFQEAPKPRRARTTTRAKAQAESEAAAAAMPSAPAAADAKELPGEASAPSSADSSPVRSSSVSSEPANVEATASAAAAPQKAPEVSTPAVEVPAVAAAAAGEQPAQASEGASRAEGKPDEGKQRSEKPYKRERRERNRDKQSGEKQKQSDSRNDSRKDNRNADNRQNNGKQNNQRQNNNQHQSNRDNDRRQRRRNQQREVVPSVTKEELAELKVAELRAKAVELNVDVTGLKKAELVDAVFDASMKAEGFIEVAGVLDILADGYGFLRATGYLPGEGDAYVGTSTIRRNGLRKGDFVVGQTRPARENEKFAAIQKVISVNGVPIEELGVRPRFADLTPVYPDDRLLMEHGKNTTTARVIDLCAPIGKGQRGLIVSPPKAGKTTVLKDIAASITANNPEVHLMCLLVDERPEEVTDMERSIRGEVVSSTFDMPSENHIAVAELVIERAKRLVEMGKDVVILLDSITRLARAYNLAQPASGRILSGGVDSTALYPPKRFLGAARNIENGGSLTILASALIDTGSKMDEVIFEEFKGTGNMELKLDRNLADRRIFPAIDPVASGTRKEELLLNPQEAPLIWAVRRILSNMNNTERAMDTLIKSLKQTDTNQEFLIRTAKKAQTQHGKSDENFEF